MTRESVLFSQYCISLGLCCVLVYMYGFFPIKTSTNVFSSTEQFPSFLQDIKFHKEKLYNGSVGKIVLMVIDGIRVDFVTAENMPHTGSLLAAGGGCQLTARASAPTVTLPKIKAIVSGSVSSFIDIVLNFDTKELSSDNIVDQVVQSKRVVFYGDDTWIRLFPHHFTRSEGTSSFYVNDYTEVDNNVTRHLEEELQRSDWDLMILHYLGLDHIGHLEGPKSRLIKPKLREMDDIIGRLHAYLQKQHGGVLVVCGDHGMKDSGSHGGVSLPEVLVPVVVLGLSCPDHHKKEILQVDLAPTLSVLWGTPIPADSIGVAATALLGHLSPAQRIYSLLYNSHQLSANFLRNSGSLQHESYRKLEEAKQRHYDWLINSDNISHHTVEALYQDSLMEISRFLSEVLTNYDLSAMFLATFILLQIICLLHLRLVGVSWCFKPVPLASFTVIGVLMMTRSGWPLPHSLVLPFVLSYNTLILYSILILYYRLGLFPPVLKIYTHISWHLLIPFGTALFCVSMFSSSLIEEEHQLWYFLWATVITLRLSESPTRWFCILLGHRFLRTLNQTGDKWAHLPDLSDWLTLTDQKPLLSALFILTLVWVCWCCAQVTPHRYLVSLYVFTAVCIYLHKAALHQVSEFPVSLPSAVLSARVCWLLLLLMLLGSRSLGCLLVCWMLASCLVLRPYNAMLVPALFLFSRAVSSSPYHTLINTVLHYWLAVVFFFYQGNSNSLASVDVASGYAGLDQYNFVIVGTLLLFHTYSMPVLAYLLNIHSIINKNKYWRAKLVKSGEVVVILHLLHVLVFLLVITLQRYHLFVWTVFSPKLLYVAAQTFVYFFLISITNICVHICA